MNFKFCKSKTYRIAYIHITTIFNDDFTLLSCWSIGHRLDIFMNDKFLSNSWSHWLMETFNNEENDKEEEEGKC